MQNKGAIQIFAILLTIACAYHLSFTYITSRIENRATVETNGDPKLEKNYLDSIRGEKLPFPWGLLGFTYSDAKLRELNLGLDLKGGMNVTLEVSIPDLLRVLARNTTDSAFNKALHMAQEKQKSSQVNFVDLFIDSYESINPNGKLANPLIFGHNGQSMIKTSMSNNEVRAILKKEADQAVTRTYEVLNSRIDNFGVTQPNIQILEGTDRILVELPGVKDPERIQNLLAASAKLEFWMTYQNEKIYPEFQKIDDFLLRSGLVEGDSTQTADLGTTDTTGIDSLASDSLRLAQEKADSVKKAQENTGENISAEEYRKLHPFSSLIYPAINQEGTQYIPGPRVGFAATFDTAKINRYLRIPQVQSLLPKDLVLAWEQKTVEVGNAAIGLIALRKNPNSKDRGSVLEGDVIDDASSQPNQKGGGYMVEMKMNGEGAREWAKITKTAAENKECIAIVLDGKVYSYPTVNEAITGGISSITGSFSYDEAKTLASVLKAGKLPTPTIVVEQAVVGPSLGQKSIRAGLLSLSIAFVIILIYMAFYYGRAGITADIALFTNVFFLMGCLAAMGATLTLPGITGIVLTIGMSVDANVLIFERVREELRHGKGLKLALNDGYKQAYRAIIDSNVTTLLIALILTIFGAGPVKGFGVTLFWGILTSMFSAIFISRLIFEWQLKRKQKITFSIKMTENFLRHANFDFVGRRKIFYLVSGIMILAGVVSFFTKGFNMGVDLKGGRSYTITFDNSNVTPKQVTDLLEPQFGSTPTVKYYGSSDRIKIITKYRLDDTGTEVDNEIAKEMYDVLAPLYSHAITFDEFTTPEVGYGISESAKIGPTVARDVKIKSIYAVVLSLLMMFGYILFRFKGWQYATGALLALTHDVIIVLAVFSIFDGILPFSLEIDQAIIAAVLTVIGYSINDTVIIFDRVREYLGEGRKDSMKQLINSALNSTLGRTVNTSLTVLFVLIIGFLFGGESIKGLSFAILIGVVVGTYSSICIATPIVVDLGGRNRKSGESNPNKNSKLAKA